MNTVLSSLSWSAYFEMMALLLIIYYGVVGYKCYRPELLALTGKFTGEQGASGILPDTLLAEEPVAGTTGENDDASWTDDTIERTEQFIIAAKAVIGQYRLISKNPGKTPEIIPAIPGSTGITLPSRAQ